MFKVLSRQDAATAIRQDVPKRILLTIHRSEASGEAVMPRWILSLQQSRILRASFVLRFEPALGTTGR